MNYSPTMETDGSAYGRNTMQNQTRLFPMDPESFDVPRRGGGGWNATVVYGGGFG